MWTPCFLCLLEVMCGFCHLPTHGILKCYKVKIVAPGFWWWKIIIDSHNKKKDCMKLRISGNTNSMYLFYIWLFILGFPCANCHIVDMAIQEAIVTPLQLFFNLISTWKSHLWLWVVENEIHNLVRKLTKFYAALNNLNKASMFYLLLLARVYV